MRSLPDGATEKATHAPTKGSAAADPLRLIRDTAVQSDGSTASEADGEAWLAPVHRLIEVRERRHLGDQRVALIAPLLVDRHQIGDADAFARLDEAGGPAAEGRDRGRVDVDLATLHRQEHAVAAAEADDHA